MSTTQQSNRLIAEFMGYQHSDVKEVDDYEMDNLRYHDRWDALMPVVERISRVPFDGRTHPQEEDEQEEKLKAFVEWLGEQGMYYNPGVVAWCVRGTLNIQRSHRQLVEDFNRFQSLLNK